MLPLATPSGTYDKMATSSLPDDLVKDTNGVHLCTTFSLYHTEHLDLSLLQDALYWATHCVV